VPRLTQLFNRKDAHPIVVDVALFELFGPEWVSWDPDSTFAALERQLRTSVSRANKQRIYGLSVFHSNHAYWEDWRAFEAISWSFSGKQVDLAQLTPLTPIVALYGYKTARLMDSSSQFSDEVQAYLTGVFIHDQYSLAPPELSFIQDRIFQAKPQTKERATLPESKSLAIT
jgi:hypothetical protein